MSVFENVPPKVPSQMCHPTIETEAVSGIYPVEIGTAVSVLTVTKEMLWIWYCWGRRRWVIPKNGEAGRDARIRHHRTLLLSMSFPFLRENKSLWMRIWTPIAPFVCYSCHYCYCRHLCFGLRIQLHLHSWQHPRQMTRLWSCHCCCCCWQSLLRPLSYRQIEGLCCTKQSKFPACSVLLFSRLWLASLKHAIVHHSFLPASFAFWFWLVALDGYRMAGKSETWALSTSI